MGRTNAACLKTVLVGRMGGSPGVNERIAQNTGAAAKPCMKNLVGMKKAPAVCRSHHIRMTLDCFRVPQSRVILYRTRALPSLVTSDFYRFETYWYIGLTFLSVLIK